MLNRRSLQSYPRHVVLKMTSTQTPWCTTLNYLTKCNVYQSNKTHKQYYLISRDKCLDYLSMNKSYQKFPDLLTIAGTQITGKRVVNKDDILYRQNYKDVSDMSHLQVLLPVHLKDTLLRSVYCEAGKQPGISKITQENRQSCSFPAISNSVRK